MESHKIYVGNLVRSVTKEDIEDIFEKYGNIQGIKTDTEGGFAFVEYATLEEADLAIRATHGKEHFGRTLKVEDARPVMHHISRKKKI